MAYLPTPKECMHHCGIMIYFDAKKPESHPSADKWIPLVYEEDSGIYTNIPHECPNRPRYGNGAKQQTQQQQTQQPQQQTQQELKPIWDIINAKLDKILALLGKGA